MHSEDPKDENSLLSVLRQALRPIAPLTGETVLYRLEDRLAYHRCPAISLAVIRGGALAEAAAFGVADVQAGRAANGRTLFQAASMSKPVAAILVQQLVQDGRLDLDAGVAGYLTKWKLPPGESGWPPVTLRGLLSHRSGATTVRFQNLHPDTPCPSMVEILDGRSPAINAPLVFTQPQGIAEVYSNTGMTLVQLVIEEVSGDRFQDLARRRIFDPLGLADTMFSQPLLREFQANAAVGHQNGHPMEGVWPYQPQLAAAGLWTTAADYARLLQAFRSAVRGEDKRLLPEQQARAMLERQGGEFGLGWILWGEGRGLRFGHSGSNQGFRCLSTLSPDTGDGFVVMTNADSGKQVYTEAVQGLAVICGWSDLAAIPRDPVSWTEPLLTALDGVYLFDGDVAPPFRLLPQGGRLLRHALKDPSEIEPWYLDATGLIFSRDSIFGLEIMERSGGAVTEMRVLEDGKNEVARVRRDRN